jgi:hypothetical protein
MIALDWLQRHAPGFQLLSEDERSAIMQFSFLWSLFEANVLNTKGNARSIVAAVGQWSNEGLITDEAFDRELAYFQDRYYAVDAFTPHFDHLHLRPHDQRELVKRVLKGEAEDLSDVAAALLIIVYRFRNNLFHGVKWSYELRGQLENFLHANAVLMLAIELHERSTATS